MKQGIVISDLHLLSWRSEGETHFETFSDKLNEVDTLVLNGDIFDFRWAIRPHAETIPEAIFWLRQLTEQFPHLDIHFIPGNHDCLPEFTDQVETLTGINQHSHLLRLGRNLFLHGDAASYPMDYAAFRKFRSSWENDQPCRKPRARLYDFSDAIKLSELTHHLWFMGNTAIRRIAYHLEKTYPQWQEDIDHCYFGHTHMPIDGVERDGITYYNTGSAIRGMEFSPLYFTHHETQ